MKITIITLFPKMFSGFLEESIIKRAKDTGKVEIEVVDLRIFAKNERGSVDERPYGGGAGMVLRADVIEKALSSVKNKILKQVQDDKIKVVLTSAKGKSYNQAKAKELSQLDHIVIIAGHYEGVDERIMKYIDDEISVGDFIVTGGEIPSALIIDSIVRLIPGVLKKEEATVEESFFEVEIAGLIKACGEDEHLGLLIKNGFTKVKLLEYPHYTRPEVFDGEVVPSVLLSGNHEKIREWRLQEAYKETKNKRPDLLAIKVK